MIVLTVGTHHQPFDRLVALGARLAGSGEAVFVQAGTSRLRPSGCEVVDFCTPALLAERISEARAVICHAGPGTLFMAWDAGHHPIVMPRDPALDEHVDDHQLRFAGHLGDRAIVARDTDEVLAALKLGADVLRPGPVRPGGEAGPGFVEAFGTLADEVARGDRHGRPLRGILGQFVRAWGLFTR